MTTRIAQVLLFTLIMAGMIVSAHAEDERVAGDGFLSSTIDSVLDKMNKFTSGEEGIFIKDFDKPDESRQDYSKDALGRKIQEPTIRTSTKASSAKGASVSPAAPEKKEPAPVASGELE